MILEGGVRKQQARDLRLTKILSITWCWLTRQWLSQPGTPGLWLSLSCYTDSISLSPSWEGLRPLGRLLILLSTFRAFNKNYHFSFLTFPPKFNLMYIHFSGLDFTWNKDACWMNDVVLIYLKWKVAELTRSFRKTVCLSLITHRYSTQFSSSGARDQWNRCWNLSDKSGVSRGGHQVPRVLTRDFSLSLSFNMRLLSTS